MGRFIIGWAISALMGFAIGAFIFRDRPPGNNACRCYYDRDGRRAWPGENYPIHKKKKRSE